MSGSARQSLEGQYIEVMLRATKCQIEVLDVLVDSIIAGGMSLTGRFLDPPAAAEHLCSPRARTVIADTTEVVAEMRALLDFPLLAVIAGKAEIDDMSMSITSTADSLHKLRKIQARLEEDLRNDDGR